jgi:putative endopeptidase
MHIGHELSHGFDSVGARRDLEGTGTLFTDEDMAVFNEKSAKIAAALSQIESGHGNHLLGEQLVYEAMADMTGMTLMLDLAKKEENFNYEAFFRAFAGLFFSYDQGNIYKPDGNGRVDPHPPSYVRINHTVALFEEFYRTYPAVTEGTPIYIAPENRTLAW